MSDDLTPMNATQATEPPAEGGAGAVAATPVEPVGKPRNPKLGYFFAALNAIISGFAIYVNSLGVHLVADSTLYTTLKNCVVGLALLIPFLLLAGPRAELTRLTRKQWALLLLITLVGGSIAYALDFRGLQISTAPTAAIVDHTQFLFVAIIAAIFIGERFGGVIWVALGVLFIGLCLGVKFNAVRLDNGVYFLFASTVMFAVAAVLIKVTLHTVSILTVMVFKMTLGAALLLVYVAATGRLGAVAHLNATQWGFVIVTGLILLAFTVTVILGLRNASATGVIAISAGSPIITTLLVVFTRHTPIPTLTLLGLGLVLVAVLLIYAFGQRQEMRTWERAQPVGLGDPMNQRTALT